MIDHNKYLKNFTGCAKYDPMGWILYSVHFEMNIIHETLSIQCCKFSDKLLGVINLFDEKRDFFFKAESPYNVNDHNEAICVCTHASWVELKNGALCYLYYCRDFGGGGNPQIWEKIDIESRYI